MPPRRRGRAAATKDSDDDEDPQVGQNIPRYILYVGQHARLFLSLARTIPVSPAPHFRPSPSPSAHPSLVYIALTYTSCPHLPVARRFGREYILGGPR